MTSSSRPGGLLRGDPEYTDLGSTGSKWYLRQAAYLSMRRLGLEHIDLYYLPYRRLYRHPVR
jgi:pyridoxine 4-dehydrogenase